MGVVPAAADWILSTPQPSDQRESENTGGARRVEGPAAAAALTPAIAARRLHVHLPESRAVRIAAYTLGDAHAAHAVSGRQVGWGTSS